jgi:hypothetical protein
MRIELSDETFQRLQRLAEPLIDSVEDVIIKAIEVYEQRGDAKMKPLSPATPRQIQSIQTPLELRGFQRELWEMIISKMPTQRLSLRDVYARKQPLVERRPHVKEIEASIRAGLEKLRDKGYIEFIDNRGQYRRRK